MSVILSFIIIVLAFVVVQLRADQRKTRRMLEAHIRWHASAIVQPVDARDAAAHAVDVHVSEYHRRQ